MKCDNDASKEFVIRLESTIELTFKGKVINKLNLRRDFER